MGTYPLSRARCIQGNLIIAETSLIRNEFYNVLLKWNSFIFLMFWDYIEVWWVIKPEKQGGSEVGDGVRRRQHWTWPMGTQK